ncbi:peroxisome assembly protein (Peroxin-2) [Tieghemiomyces parasiticus]|uniref:RING-type E3 ubiquitin transferase (cysteine targeting) n=1 Tax=Tieghemiomyces parasiticus TaxID=78921 RepID=A0A9W7ZSQ9_9FUNG|nr:peroxisome assembly protein (Peroxin-2) [Tieghemiomyces parasiticus]
MASDTLDSYTQRSATETAAAASPPASSSLPIPFDNVVDRRAFYEPAQQEAAPRAAYWHDQFHPRPVTTDVSSSATHPLRTILSPATWPARLRTWLPVKGEHVARVSQLDTDLLDADLLDTLKQQWQEGVRLFKSTLVTRLEPEITALFQLAIYGLTVARSQNATYGAELQNLRYRNEFKHQRNRFVPGNAPLTQGQKILYGTLLVGGQYLWTRTNRHLTDQGWGELPETSPRKKAWQALQFVDKWYHTLSMVNFLAFLYSGRYKSLLTRLLGMRLVYSRPQMQSQVSYEYLNRQMVWYAFTEFLMFILPLVSPRRLKRSLQRGYQRTAERLGLPTSQPDQAQAEAMARIPRGVCVICLGGGPSHTRAVLPITTDPLPEATAARCRVRVPYVTNCGHIFCYVCLVSQMAIDAQDHACLRCGQSVKSMRRLEANEWCD